MSQVSGDMSQTGRNAEPRFRMVVRDSNGKIVTTPGFLVYEGWNITLTGTGVILRKGAQMSVMDSFTLTGVYFTYDMVEVINHGGEIIVRQAGANQPEPERSEFMTGEEGEKYFVTLIAHPRKTCGSGKYPAATGSEESAAGISDTGGELRLDHGQGYTIVVRLFEIRKRPGDSTEKHMPRGWFNVDIDPR